MPCGRFITLEGGEGAGKSTQARILAASLAEEGTPVLCTREPGGTPGAERLRDLLLSGEIAWSPLADMMLHFAARAEHVKKLIRPALEAGMWVVCDRFSDSTMAYQGYGLGGDRDAITALTRLVGLTPDLTIVLDLDVHQGFARVRRRSARMRRREGAADRYEQMGTDFFARVSAGFSEIAGGEPARCVIVPAAESEALVAERIASVVAERLE